MDLRIRIECDDADEATASELTGAFADWLVEDRDVAAHADIRKLRTARDDGGMSGDVVAWLELAASYGFSAASLVYAHLSYRASLPRRLQAATRMVVEYRATRVTIEGGSAEDVALIARALGTTDPTPAAPSINPPA